MRVGFLFCFWHLKGRMRDRSVICWKNQVFEEGVRLAVDSKERRCRGVPRHWGHEKGLGIPESREALEGRLVHLQDTAPSWASAPGLQGARTLASSSSESCRSCRAPHW